MVRALAVMIGTCLFWAAWGEAQVPPRIHYQGRLFNRLNGEPLNGLVRFRFRLWDSPENDGNPADDVLLWDEPHGFEQGEGQETEPVLVESGFYEVELGRNNPIPAEIFSATNVYLEIQVENDAPMIPRQRIVTVPFAFQADLLDGRQASDFATAADVLLHASDPAAHHAKTVDAGEIVSGVFSEDRIPPSIPRQSDFLPFEQHVADTDNPHQVTLQQAGAVTLHSSLIGAEGHLGHAAIDAHILGLVASATTPLYGHRCPDDMARVGASCVDKRLYRDPGESEPLPETWFQAALKCASRGRRLCSNSEWYVGCRQADSLGILQIDEQEEWVDEWATDITSTQLWPVVRGGGGTISPCESAKVVVPSETNKFKFRCCR